MFDVHTHNLNAPAGKALISLPREAFLCPTTYPLRPDAYYSAGIHPWWTENAEDVPQLLDGFAALHARKEVVAIGECGIDLLRGGNVDFQQEILRKQLFFAEETKKDVILHVVRAHNIIWRMRAEMRPAVRWIVHGFRGGPQLVEQYLGKGFYLSFGTHYNAEAYALTPEARRLRESDEDF